jgi:hypothetical protein
MSRRVVAVSVCVHDDRWDGAYSDYVCMCYNGTKTG